MSQEVTKAKEKLEQVGHQLKEAGQKRYLGDATLTAGELAFTLIGLGIIGLSYWKLTGSNRKYAMVAGVLLIIIGECLF